MAVVAAVWILASGLTASALGGSPALPVAMVFVAISALLIPLDLRAHRLPRGVLLGGVGIVIAVQIVVALDVHEPDRLLGVASGLIIGWLVLIIARHAAPGGAGFGDAAYAALAGGALGWFGPERVVLGLGFGLILGAVAAGPLTLAMNRAVIERSPSVALRPALAAGAWIALCWGDSFIGWYGR